MQPLSTKEKLLRIAKQIHADTHQREQEVYVAVKQGGMTRVLLRPLSEAIKLQRKEIVD